MDKNHNHTLNSQPVRRMDSVTPHLQAACIRRMLRFRKENAGYGVEASPADMNRGSVWRDQIKIPDTVLSKWFVWVQWLHFNQLHRAVDKIPSPEDTWTLALGKSVQLPRALLPSTNSFDSGTRPRWKWTASNNRRRCPNAAWPVSEWFRPRCWTCREEVRLFNPVLHFPTFWQVCPFQFPNANWQRPFGPGSGVWVSGLWRDTGDGSKCWRDKRAGNKKKRKRNKKKEMSWRKLASGSA